MEERKIDPKHSGVRGFLRVVGPVVLIAGVVCVVYGFANVFGAAKSVVAPSPPPGFAPFGDAGGIDVGGGFSGAGYIFAGFPLIFVGLVMTIWGYMGAAARYAAAEVAPVGKDTFNYVAGGTRGGVKTVAQAIGSGLAEGMRGQDGAGTEVKQVIRCHKCNAENDGDSKFCDQCGAALVKSRACPQCGELNDGDARFCDNCGHRFEGG